MEGLDRCKYCGALCWYTQSGQPHVGGDTCHDVVDRLRARWAVAEGVLTETRDVLRDLLATLPRCDACAAPATHAYVRGAARYCPAHAPANCPPYPRHDAVMRARALLGGQP